MLGVHPPKVLFVLETLSPKREPLSTLWPSRYLYRFGKPPLQPFQQSTCDFTMCWVHFYQYMSETSLPWVMYSFFDAIQLYPRPTSRHLLKLLHPDSFPNFPRHTSRKCPSVERLPFLTHYFPLLLLNAFFTSNSSLNN